MSEYHISELAPTFFEQIAPKKLKKHANVLAIILFFILNNIALGIFITHNYSNLIISTLFLLVILTLIPLFNIFTRNRLLGLKPLLTTFVNMSDSELESWIRKITKETITGRWGKRISGVVTAIVGISILLILGLPFRDTFLTIWAYISVTIILFIFGDTSYIYLMLILLPSRIAKLPLKIPLYQDSFTGITSLNRPVLSFSLFGIIFYSTFYGAIYFSPFNGEILIFILLGILAIGGLSILPFALFGLHTAMVNGKRDTLSQLAKRLEMAIKASLDSPTVENISTVKSLFELQKELNNLPEWPIDLKTIITLVTTLILPLAGILISIIRK